MGLHEKARHIPCSSSPEKYLARLNNFAMKGLLSQECEMYAVSINPLILKHRTVRMRRPKTHKVGRESLNTYSNKCSGFLALLRLSKQDRRRRPFLQNWVWVEAGSDSKTWTVTSGTWSKLRWCNAFQRKIFSPFQIAPNLPAWLGAGSILCEDIYGLINVSLRST